MVNNDNFSNQSYSARVINSMYGVYAWMCLALALTAGTAYYVSITPAFFMALNKYPSLLIVLMIAQLALVVILSMFLQKMNLVTAIGLFILYSLSMGVTLSAIFWVYTLSSIFATFLVTAGMFGAMAIYGYVTKTDLSSIGSIALMAIIGLILGGLVNMFLKSESFDYVLSAVGVVVFTLLTAYDVQKIKYMTQEMQADGQDISKISIMGALMLYLDFVNLFLYLLRFMGRKKE